MTAGTVGAGQLGPGGYAAGAGPDGASLSSRLTAIARMVQIGSARSGPDGFGPELLEQARETLDRAGERLRMSADHTVVTLAGGTGSGKSSLFNQLAGAEFSPAGVVRPMTREPYACVWGMDGAGPLLEWLGVARRNRYARSSALDDGERSMAGLLLLDLPDHDSVLAGTSSVAGRLLTMADLLVWVLDPQKYADASVHRRYLVPMAGHSAVTAVVLNQADRLTRDQADDCVADLQRLLEAEGLHDTPVLLTSAVTGDGLDEVRRLLVETVIARQARADRIAADVDALAARFAAYVAPARPAWVTPGPAAGAGRAGQGSAGAGHGEQDGAAGGDGRAPSALPDASRQALVGALAQAAGMTGVGRTLQSARELRAVDYVGWPVSWLAGRLLRRDPVRKMRLGSLWDEMRGVSAGPGGAQEADVDNAITAFVAGLGPGLPAPWPAAVRNAARSRADDVPAALGAAVAAALPPENAVAPWWRLVATWQGLLLGVAGAALAWAGGLLAIGVLHVAHAAPLFSDVSLLPWALASLAVSLVLGWLTGITCMSVVSRIAGHEREQAERRMRESVADVARQMVVMPVEQELSEYTRFSDALAMAASRP